MNLIALIKIKDFAPDYRCLSTDDFAPQNGQPMSKIRCRPETNTIRTGVDYLRNPAGVNLDGKSSYPMTLWITRVPAQSTK